MVNKENIFCSQSTLRNESDVEQFFTIRLLTALGYEDNDIHTKKTVIVKNIGKGSKKKEYRPDYLIYFGNNPVLAIDVKHPNIDPMEGLKDALMYAREINGGYIGKNPIIFCIGTNGIATKISKWDENKPLLTLKFDDFQNNNKEYSKLINLISKESFESDFIIKKGDEFEFRKPEISEVNGIFKACHNLIWKKEKIGPTEAFYEFAKLFFIKLNHDKELHQDLIKKNKIPQKEDFLFSLHWINNQKKTKSPISEILFKDLRNGLERDILDKKRKRIFDINEKLKLKPSTIKEVVKLLEHLDFFAIDEDLNGRMFETFLNATVRGKELGQFFTPRSVVKLMVKLANPKVGKNHTDVVLDACCGSGGFLIDVMADMFEKIKLLNLTNYEKDSLRNDVITEHLWGIDANLRISRIARMNMFLHGDGGSKIFWLPDSLDKKIEIEEGISEELQRDAQEFKTKIINENFKFNVILTNPPFSMKYERKKEDEKKIIQEYDIAYKNNNKETNELKASLKSNVLFIERYYDLLNENGKLITIIDETVLNADKEKDYRKFIKDHFIIKAVISLPRNTFVNADTNVKTSILYLRKKIDTKEEQQETFFAISNNVGHSDSGKPIPKQSDLDYILDQFRKFENE